MSVYRGPFICGSYWAKQYGWKEGWWYVWNGSEYIPTRKATESEKRAGDGAY